MRVRFYNHHGDLVLGLAKVRKVELKPNRSVDLTLSDSKGEFTMTVVSTDYETMKVGGRN